MRATVGRIVVSSAAFGAWLERVDPGTHRRIKGLRLVTAYALGAMLGRMPEIAPAGDGGAALSSLAGGFALWASVSEARTERAGSSRDLILLCAAAGLGAGLYALLSPLLASAGRAGPELTLASGAFCVGWFKRFGILGGGIGSQIYIGQVLAYGAHLGPADLRIIAIAASVAALASIVPRLLSGPAEHPVVAPPLPPSPASTETGGGLSPDLVMGLQAGLAALAIVALNETFGLLESAWAITACTYVVASSAAGTLDRARRRILGTAVGVPLGLACLPLTVDAPLLVWTAAGIAMIIYAVTLPDRYDIACGAYAFTLVLTLAVGGEHSPWVLAARGWETLLGGLLGALVAEASSRLLHARPTSPAGKSG